MFVFSFNEDVANLIKYNNIKLNIQNGETIKLPSYLRIEPYTKVYRGNTLTTMGSFSYANVALPWGTTIGRYCSIAKGLEVFGADHFVDWISTSPRFYTNEYQSLCDADLITHQKREMRCVNIGHDVWIGANVTLKKCITIGNGSIIGAGSVVTHDVPPFAIVAGIPAKIIKWRFSPEIIKRIDHIQWWNYHINDLKHMNAENPKRFLELLEQKIALNKIRPYNPIPVTFDDFARCNLFFKYSQMLHDFYNLITPSRDYSKNYFQIYLIVFRC